MVRQFFSLVVALGLVFAPALTVPAASGATVPLLTVSENPTVCPDAQFTTIQAAIDAASPGANIHVCAGTYAEQLSISKPISLSGDNGVVIQPSGVVANSTGTASGQPIAAIILVQETPDVNISDLIVDGANGDIKGCAPDFIGIFYRNASGEISRVPVRNVKLAASLNGCQSGSGILVQSGGGAASIVTVENSSIHNYQKNGITANEFGTKVRIEGNVVTGVGPTTGAAQNGIQIGFGAAGSIERNTVANHIWSPCISTTVCDFSASDILVVQSDRVKLDQNRAGISQVGIAVLANHAQVTGNRVFDTQVFDGIQLVGNDNDAESNRIVHSDESGVFIQGNNNVVVQNTIDEAAFGVLKLAGSSGNIIAGNDFHNVTVKVLDPSRAASKVSPYR
jgi:nitrous oxidase accessory protein NosD